MLQNSHFQWIDEKEYPFSHRFLNVNGHQLHYIDEGQGDVLLFVHGTPSWSFDFRYQIKALSEKYRCIALDHIGFGLSSKPEVYDYSTPNHAKTLSKLIETLDLKEITLVVHDFGGVIGLDYAVKNPNNIKRIIALNTWLWDASNEPEYLKMLPILKSPLLPILYKWFNFSPKILLRQSFFDKKKLTKSIHQHYIKPFSKINERKGTLAFAKSLLNDQKWFQSLWEKVNLLQKKPVLLIWGMEDSFILPKYLDKLQAVFSQKTIVKLEKCGHFPQEEAKEEVLTAISLFLKA